MSTRIVIRYTSDLSGKELQDRYARPTTFAIDGDEFEIDLSLAEKNHMMRLMKRYVDNGRRLPTPEFNAEVRAWAKDNGVEVSERGRIAQSVIDRYTLAQMEQVTA